MAAQVPKLTPRKKFTLQAEIKVSLARFKHQYSGSWNFIPDKRIIRQITTMYTDRVLYVKGQSAPMLGLQRVELLAYMHSLPLPDEKEQPTGRRLAQIPLFYSSALPPQKYSSNSISCRASLNEMRQNYITQEIQHKTVEGHHPDGIGWRGGLDASIECVFDVYSGLLRFHNVKSAYIKLLEILKDNKFDNLDSDGVLYALMHIICRGVSNSARFKQSVEWRQTQTPQEQLWKYVLDFSNGIPPGYLIQGYRAELYLHSFVIDAEMKRLRIGEVHHDWSKFKENSIYWYAFNWGVWTYLSDQNKKMLELGINIYDKSDKNNYPTMYSLGNSFAQGAFSNPEVNQVLSLVRNLPDDLEKKVIKVTEELEHKIDRKEESFRETAQDILREFRETSTTLVDESLNKIVDRSKELGTALATAADPMMDILKSLQGFVESVVAQIDGFLKPIEGFSSLKISVKNILEALKYYILYINSTSTSIKMILILLIINALGIGSEVFKWVIQFWKWSSSATLNGEIVDAQETSFLEWIQESPVKFATMIGGAFASMAKGTSLSMNEFLKFSKDLSDKMRNFHFIGMGFAGLERIYDYARRFWLFLSEWISCNIFGRTPEKEQKAREVAKLLVLAKYFSTEAGLNAIRMSENARVRAEGLMPEYLRLLSETRDNKEFRHMYMDLDRNYRIIREIANFTTRFRAVSNFQPTMFHIQLVGKPGIGKSTLTKNLVSDLTKSLWPEEPKPSFYSLNMNLEYFDGYAGQKIMIADDVYKMNEPKHMTSTIGLITNTPVILPMADLADKGVQLTSEIFLSSTNTAYPIAKDVLCMEAVHRRRHMLVQVTCDPNVIDEGCSQFSDSLFQKYYPGQNKSDFPHLKFGLIKPVPKEFGGAAEQVKVGDDEFKLYAEYASLLKDANFKIACGKEELDPCFYFSENNLPGGFSYPASNWTYKQFLSNCVVRFRSFRGMEGTYSSTSKYSHAETCLAELDMLFSQSDDLPAHELPIGKLIENNFVQLSKPFINDDPIGDKIASGSKLVPELDDIDFDKLVDEIIKEKSQKQDVTNPTVEGIDLNEERERRRRILQRRARRVVPMEVQNQLKTVRFGLRSKILLVENPTQWEPTSIACGRLDLATVVAQQLNVMQRSLGVNTFVGVRRGEQAFAERDQQYTSFKGWLKTAVQAATTPLNAQRSLDSIFKTLISEDMPIPNHFPRSRGDHTMPIGFLHRIEKIDGLWYMDVTDLSFDCAPPVCTKRLEVDGEDYPYEVVMDLAYWFAHITDFRMFLSRFFSYTEEQRLELIEDAKFRNEFTGSYTYAKVAEECTNIYAKLGYKTLHYIVSPFKWLLSTFPIWTTYAGVLLAFACVITLIKKICSLFNPEPTSKVLHRGPQSNIVYRGKPTACNPTRLSENLLERNVKKIRLADSQRSVGGQCLCTGQYIILNKHVTKWMNDNDILLTLIDGNGESDYWIEKSNIYEDPDGDLAIIWSRYVPAARDIARHFISEADYDADELRDNISILTRKPEYPIMEHFPVIGKVDNLTLQNSDTSMTLAKALMVSGNTVLGNSGSTVVVHHGSLTSILGIQAWQVDALYSPKIAIQIVTAEKFEELKKALSRTINEPIVARTFEPDPSDVSAPCGAFESVPAESIICNDDHCVGDVGRNLIKPSFISSHLAKVGIETKRVPAPMSHRDPRLFHGGEIHPMAHSLGKYYRGKINPISPNIVNRATHMLQKYIVSRLDTQNFDPLTIEETITGTREDGSNPMNLKSSPGIPFIFEKRERKGKRDYMEIGEDGEVIHIDENFINEYFKFESSLARGEIPYTRAYDFPKDELRAIEKALGSNTTPPKTRSVTCMNVYYILAWRRYTLRFWSAMHRAADGTFSFCPGINPEGPEWNNLYHYLNQHPNAVDFDVSNWDGFLFSQLFYKVLDIIKHCMRVRARSDVDYILSSIFYDVMNCYIQYLDVVYQKHRGLVSGFPGTAEVNTLVHWLLYICIYLKVTQGTPYNNFESLIKLTSVAIYGDDIIITFSDEIKDIFHGLILKECYESIGYPVTSATKAAEVERSKKLLDCKFLKSTWTQFLPGYWIRKMDMDVAHDLVHWVRAKQHPRAQFFDNYMDALHIAFGNGKQVFEEFQRVVNGVLAVFHEDNVHYDYEDFEFDYIQRYLPNLLEYN